MKQKIEAALSEAWDRYQKHDSGYKPGFFSRWRHNSISAKKRQFKKEVETALAKDDLTQVEILLDMRLKDGDFNNGSFNNILVNALQKNGIKTINNIDLNTYRPQEKRILKAEENEYLYRFDSRSFETIRNAGGFTAQQHSDLYDDILNVKSGPIGVSFTTDKQVAIAYMLKRIKEGITEGGVYTVKLSKTEADNAFALSKTAKERGDSDLWLRLKGGMVTVTEEHGQRVKRSKEEVNVVPEKGTVAVSFESIVQFEPVQSLTSNFKEALQGVKGKPHGGLSSEDLQEPTTSIKNPFKR